MTVGDGGVGKTCLLTTYACDRFPTDYVPTIVDAWSGTLLVNGQQCSFGHWDTAGISVYVMINDMMINSSMCL